MCAGVCGRGCLCAGAATCVRARLPVRGAPRRAVSVGVGGYTFGMDIDALTSAEALVGDLNEKLTAPGERECLPCYLVRMTTEFGCGNRLRWSEHWRDHNAPRATALSERLMDRGGFCDCEVLFNVYPEYLLEDDEDPVPCSGVSRKGSTKPCRPVRPRGRRAGWE